MRLIQPVIPSPVTELHIGHGLLQSDLLSLCKKFGSKIAVVVDASIKDLFGAPLAQKLNAKLFTVPSGEEAKTLASCNKLIDQLFEEGFGKTSLLIAIGGGATTDAVGFVASIYMRGISLLLIPTTLLGMVDAAIGGKTALDTSFGKNLLGTTYHPKAVLIDLDILKTLPPKEVQNGMAEVIKMGLIFDPAILGATKEKQIELAIHAKIATIEKDPTEKGLRRILNFGHTIGHALEKISDYRLRHGEAVAIGSLAAAHLSMQLGFLPEQEFKKIEKLYPPFSLPSNYTRDKLFETMRHDKKAIDGAIRFVLIDRIGHALEFDGAYCRAVTKEELLPTLDWLEKCSK